VNRVERWLISLAPVPFAALAGCRSAPTFDILGSFFPSWLICLFAGILLAAVASRLSVRFALEKEILWPVVVYPCLAILLACTLWLILFS